MKAPFPWFGGKRRVAHIVWPRFGDVATYNEPFAGSLAVLLERPHAPNIETVNDIDCFISNFWRALSQDPDGVAKHADWPVNEADLHPRHRWLVKHVPEKIQEDPDWFDVKIAGWWVWGQCLWIGSGWCQKPEWTGRVNAGRYARGVNTLVGENPSEQMKRPKLRGRGNDGVPAHSALNGNKKRPSINGNGDSGGVHQRRWQGGGQGGGSGVHAPCFWNQPPDLSGDAGATGRGIHGTGFEAKTGGLYEYMRALSTRLRRVRVCCGDFERVLTPSVTTYIGMTGVLLDPPYDPDLRERCYARDCEGEKKLSVRAREWALANGDNPLMRVALCGYEDEHKDHMPANWECVAWKAHGGYSRGERAVENREQERIWFSPHCLKPDGFSAIAGTNDFFASQSEKKSGQSESAPYKTDEAGEEPL